jgi:dTDP-4-amino-4,6-dideoxygalactose transaminase
LRSNGVETRPFLCGDFTNQPALKKIRYEKPYKCHVADTLHKRSIALPCHQDISFEDINKIFELLDSYL